MDDSTVSEFIPAVVGRGSLSHEPNWLPTESELKEMFSDVLGVWVGWDAEIGRMEFMDLDELTLSRKVVLTCWQSVFLALRSTPAFARELAAHVSVEDGRTPLPEDAFGELLNIYAGHFLTRFAVRGAFLPYLPKKSQPSEWPQRVPDAACFLDVQGYPLEIWVWIGQSPGRVM